MAYDESLKNVSTHFEFGDNWANFSKSISEEKIREAELGLQNLITGTDLSDRSFLDIGCGSGIHSLAALNLGAKSVTAIDIDPASVETSKNVLATYSSTDQFRTMVGNVFAPPFDDEEKFDVVYSWGVLHHTGSMWEAIQKAIELVRPGGELIIAIYLKTRFCSFWKAEKKLFTSLPKALRWPIVWVYSALCFVRILAKGENPITHIRQYGKNRGMSWYRDRIDWLGGYPYESASSEEIVEFVNRHGGTLKKAVGTTPIIGLLGSGCAEYVFEINTIASKQ